jgi:hypothetical protein
MQKEFVPYELALRMKRLGFKENCLGTYKKEKLIITRISISESNMLKLEDCPAPLFSQAFRWFREEYDLHHVIHHFTHKKGTDEAYLAEVGKADDIFSYCKTYEEAELACLEKLIEIVEQKLN